LHILATQNYHSFHRKDHLLLESYDKGANKLAKSYFYYYQLFHLNLILHLKYSFLYFFKIINLLKKHLFHLLQIFQTFQSNLIFLSNYSFIKLFFYQTIFLSNYSFIKLFSYQNILLSNYSFKSLLISIFL
jgi:hypothetical protein